jgi:hypothetical protein
VDLAAVVVMVIIPAAVAVVTLEVAAVTMMDMEVGGGGSYISGENTSVTTGKSGDGYVKIQLVELGSMPPTVPTNLKVTASTNSVYLTGETITVSWDASTDPEGGQLHTM